MRHSTISKFFIFIAASSACFADQQGVEFFESKIRPVLAKNCYTCHSSENKASMGGLTLDSRAGVQKGGKSGPAVTSGKPGDSLLIRAIRYENRKMPPSGKLPESVIADFEKWVSMGAPDPRESKSANWKPAGIDIEKGRQYWAFRTPQKPAAPKVKNAKWSKEPIDRLLLANLEAKKLTPVADADRATWLRRVTLDLTGLPPTPEEIEAFLKDRSKNAYGTVVDRLLASDRFGERWGRHWLDVARYADSEGRGRNYAFPFAWRYRDYVIAALNQDKPYDRFVREQLAGDLMPSDSSAKHNEQLIATGFLALGSNDLVEQNPNVFRMDVVDEQINATSRAFMGLTVGCARCHDHKFDPIPTADYYAMAGIFRSTEMLSGLQRRPRDNVSYFNLSLFAKLSYPEGQEPGPHIKDPEKYRQWQELQTQLRQMLEAPRRGALLALARKKKGAAGALPAAGMVLNGQKLREATRPILTQLDRFPLPPDLVMAVQEGKVADCEIHVRGEVDDLGPKVPRGFVQVVMKPGESPDIASNQSGRLQLAEWIASKENPLTARVAVNRIWEHLFGEGIVPTVDNFGKMGEQPVNQRLLDYLAVRFMEQGWSTKKIVREIVLSRAYRMSTANNARNNNIDPGNKLLWRQNRRRLEVEAIRDSLLMVAGKLDLNPPVESPVMKLPRSYDVGRKGRFGVDDYAMQMRNRSVYVPVLRNHLPQMFETFDFPEPSETKGRREVTTVPTQALFLMNNRWVIDLARASAKKLLTEAAATDEARISRAYMEVLGRAPTAQELSWSKDYLSQSANEWAHLYQALFASAEFRYRS